MDTVNVLPAADGADLLTSKEARRVLGVKRHAFDDLAEAAGIEPVKRVGLFRLWRRSDVERIRALGADARHRAIERAFFAS